MRKLLQTYFWNQRIDLVLDKFHCKGILDHLFTEIIVGKGKDGLPLHYQSEKLNLIYILEIERNWNQDKQTKLSRYHFIDYL